MSLCASKPNLVSFPIGRHLGHVTPPDPHIEGQILPAIFTFSGRYTAKTSGYYIKLLTDMYKDAPRELCDKSLVTVRTIVIIFEGEIHWSIFTKVQRPAARYVSRGGSYESIVLSFDLLAHYKNCYRIFLHISS